MKYDRDYFHKELLLLQNLQYNDYKDKTDFDILIDKLNSEEIYNYYDVDWCDFAYEFANYDYAWADSGYYFTENNTIESVCDRIIHREVKIKLLLFLQRNVRNLWPECLKQDYLEKKCAQLISKEIEESKRDQYHDEFASMPRPDFRAMMVSDTFFCEKTPTAQWIENHFTDKPKPKEETSELNPNLDDEKDAICNEVEKLPENPLEQIKQLTTDLQNSSSNVTQNIYLVNGNLVNGDQVAHKNENIDKNFGPISCTE